MIRGILSFIISMGLSLSAQANSEELSPEVMDIIHNTVGIGPFTLHRDELREIVARPAQLDFYALKAGSKPCYQVLDRLVSTGQASSNSVCNNDEEGYVTVSRIRELVGELEFTGGRTLQKEAQAINQLGQGLVGIMYALPSDFTNWDKSEPLTAKSWAENKTSKPVLDGDPWYINYIGHPIAGGVSTVAAKQAGATNWEAFGFSVLMSTFVWEYGNEAIIETPSIQDLVITPTVGFVFGIGMYNLHQRIQENDGRWMGSKFMGRVGMVLTDPSGEFQKGLDQLSQGRIQDFRIGFRTIEIPDEFGRRNVFQDQQLIGFGFDFKFGRKPNR